MSHLSVKFKIGDRHVAVLVSNNNAYCRVESSRKSEVGSLSALSYTVYSIVSVLVLVKK